ncbi:MAG: amino acid adenylation domain-containing protein [Chloroflexi bacterium]|nr:amino acid adenylation domain-containing protein [Chloroflexota bacterium]
MIEPTAILTGATNEIPADDADEEVFVFPASFGQQRLWFLDRFEPNSPYYNIPSALRLAGALDVAALERSLNEVVRRHESLRTTFASVDGQLMQVIAPRLVLSLPVTNLEQVPEPEREAEALRVADKEARQPFDLARGPLLRAGLLRLSENEHVALFTMHHIVSDGWSMSIFIGEIATLYQAFTAGQPSPLPDLPIQYADFAQWQRQWLQGEVLQEQLDYWRRQLGGSARPVLELPTDRPRSAVQTSRGATQSSRFSNSLLQALTALSRREGCTLFMTLMAAFQVLLYRHTGQEDICVGTPIANRTRTELEVLIGLFINTLVIRTNLSGSPSFRDLLKQVRQVTLEAYAHQDLPFEQLVEVLQTSRDMSHSPLFQVMLILQNAPAQTQELPGLNLNMIEAHSGTATYDLTLSISEMSDGLDVSAEYNTDLFDATTINQMLQHFRILLEGIVADPADSIDHLPLLAEDERHRLLAEWNNTYDGFNPDRCIHQYFEDQARRTPTAKAVVWQDHWLTYGDLNTRANQLAHHLRQRGIKPETIVGICVDRSLDMLVAVLSVLKAGGAYLPLDPLYPQDRLGFMLQDSAVPVILTQSDLVQRLPSHTAQTICLDEDWPEIVREPPDDPALYTTPDHLAYLIYTSGSTGKPKGVMITHHSLVNAYHAWEQAYELRSVRAHLQMANFAFDVFSGDWVRALCSGGKLVLCPREWLLDPSWLYDLMQRERVDCAEFVPAVLRQLIQYLKRTNQNLAFMRLLVCGSDSWQADEYRAFKRYCGPQTRLINSFGLTEATIDSSYFESAIYASPTLDLAGDQVVPIGRPFPNTRLYNLDRHLQPLPIGVPGELYVGGPGVARGYLNRPDLTTEKFIPDPFGGESGARLYRTGDLVRYRHDGNIEFLGRLDHQIKIRGFRIEPQEIETVLSQHTHVREAAVVAHEAGDGDMRLVAYISPQEQLAPTPGDLRRFVQQRLPDYMTPSAFIIMASLPLTPNGKIDRQALPPPDWSRRESEGEYIAPRTPVEEALSNIWTEVLGVSQISIHDNFFELGGHSLLATQVVSRIRDVFAVELPLRNIFESPTLATLAEHVDIAQRATSVTPVPPIRPISRDGSLPLSFAQQRLWFLDQLEPNSPSYNLPETIRLIGSLDTVVLERCLNEIVRRHESLRTTFRTIGGQPSQVIASELRVPLAMVDLRHLPPTAREAEALRHVNADTQTPFDLTHGPLLRASLLRLGDKDHIVHMTMHHIIGDEWSSNVLVQEMVTLYQAFSTHQPSPLPRLSVQYADFAHWQRHWLQGEVLQKQLDYWRKQLSGSPPLLELPTDRPRPAEQSFRGAYLTFELSPQLAEAIYNLSRQEGATGFMTLLAAFQTLLHRYTGSDDVNVGTPIANRNRAEIEALIGFFVNTLVMRANFAADPSFRALLHQVRETALGAYAHQDVPFELVVDALKPERNLSHSPLFQVMFVIQNTLLQARKHDQQQSGLTVSPVEAHSGTAKFDLTLFMLEEEGRLSGAFEYNTDLFDATTIKRMIGHFQVLLQGIVADPDQPVSTLPLLTQAERQQVLVVWNDTAAAYPSELCAHQLFEIQAQLHPNAPALLFKGAVMTYGELDRRANQLAHYLRSLGVGPEKLTGICVERSPEMVIGLLGILKAGGAYVPLDPSYPRERLGFMLADAQVTVLLTQQRLYDLLPSHHAQVICLDNGWPNIAQESEAPPLSGITPENLAYVIYTSGSTGKPKGTLIIHRGLVNYLTWCHMAYPLDAGQGAPLHSSISFDLTITALFAPLAAGRTVHVLPEDAGVTALADAIHAESGFSLVKITPAHLKMLGQQLTPDEADGRARAFVIGGENLLEEHIDFWRTHAPGTVLVNEYGPTETVVGCCVYFVPEDICAPSVIPIGRPIINTQLYVLDRHLQPVPAGVPGELYIGGAGVARGYLNQPELTAERFIPHPFNNAPGARLYKTGDLVRYLPDANLECLGRIDHQVKIRGFRIELGEIEAVLSEYPAIRQSAVLAREDVPGNKRLVAYIVPQATQQPAVDDGDSSLVSDLRAFVKSKLPEYMLPSAYVMLEALPLTPNGKVDRRMLPAPGSTRPALEETHAAPGTQAEALLADIWAQVLGVERVGVRDNFFELGGDSILSIQVIARANQAGLHLTPKQLFEHPTVVELASVAGAEQPVRAEQGVVEGPVPLTPIQCWFFEQDQPNPNHWNQSILLTVNQSLNRSLLTSALHHLLVHHDALRLRFGRAESGWQQMNAGIMDAVPLEWIDLSNMRHDERSAAITARASALQASLNLSEGPLMRAAYFDLGIGQPGRLLIIIHHLVVDGVSWRILFEDLQLVYSQLSRGERVHLPPKTTSFRDWARRLSEYAQSEIARRQPAYWVEGIPYHHVAHLPVDHPAEVNTEANANSVTVALSSEETRALLHDVSASYHAEVNDVLLAALAQAITWWMGAPLLVDLEGHGREDILNEVDVSRTVGCFTSIYPVFLDLDGIHDPGEVMLTVQKQLRNIPNHGICYGLLRYLNPDHNTVERLRAMPHAQISFNYLGQVDQTLSDTGPLGIAPEPTGLERTPQAMRTHLIDVNGGVAGGRLQVEWTYCSQLHQASTIGKLAQDFMEVLRSFITHCQSGGANGKGSDLFSDYSAFGWDQQDLTEILADIGEPG